MKTKTKEETVKVFKGFIITLETEEELKTFKEIVEMWRKQTPTKYMSFLDRMLGNHGTPVPESSITDQISANKSYKVLVKAPRVESFDCIVNLMKEFKLIKNAKEEGEVIVKLTEQMYDNDGTLHTDRFVEAFSCESKGLAKDFIGSLANTCVTGKIEEVC